MADTYYAWSNIDKAVDSNGRVTSVKPGDKVSKTDFDESDWEYYVNTGVVRTTPYPDLSTFDGSPNDFYRAKLAQAGSLDAVEALTDRDVKSLRDAGLLPAGAEVPAK